MTAARRSLTRSAAPAAPGCRRPSRPAPSPIRTAWNGRSRPATSRDEATPAALAAPTSWHTASGRTDAILLRHAYRAGSRSRTQLAASSPTSPPPSQPSRERRAGDAGLRARRSSPPPPHGIRRDLPARVAYPVAVGALAGAHGIAEDATAAAYLQAFAANLISAAVRLVPLGQTARACACSPRSNRSSCASPPRPARATLDDLGGCAFRSDIAAHAPRNPVHEAVPLMTHIPATARCASASAARSAPARPR